LFNFIKAFLGLKQAIKNNTNKEKVIFEDVYSKESSLEDIFIKLLKKNS